MTRDPSGDAGAHDATRETAGQVPGATTEGSSMKGWSDTAVLWIVFVAVSVGFICGAAWHAWVQPAVELYTPVPMVTAQTVAPAVPAEVDP